MANLIFPRTLVSLFAICVALAPAGCATHAPNTADAPLRKFESVKPKMGTGFRIVLYSADEKSARAAIDAVWARIDELNAILSDYDPNSELSRVGQMTNDRPMAQPVQVSDDLYRVLARSLEISEASGGAFDATIGPCVRLWRRSRDMRQLPTPERLAVAMASVGYQFVKLDATRHTVQLMKPHMRLDVGGIAKGFAAHECIELLRRRGINRAMVGAAGDIFVGDPPPGREGWQIAFEEPGEAGSTSGLYVQVRNCALSTSGDTYRFVEIDGQRYSHIINPKTGLGITSRVGVSLIAPTGMTADSMATAMSILDPEKSIELADQTPGVAAMVTSFDAAGKPKVLVSKRFGHYIVRGTTLPSDTSIEVD